MQLSYQGGLFPVARAAIAYIKDRNLEILAADFIDMLFAEVSVKDREILDWARENIVGTESAVAKASVFGRGLSTTAPLAFDDRFACHCDGD